MKTMSIAAVISLVISCIGGPEARTPVDPMGTWRIRITWNSGECGLIGSADTDVTVVRNPSGYSINEPHWVTTTGSVACSSDACLISFTMSGPGPGHSDINGAELNADLAVNNAGEISGTGGVTFSFTTGATCSQQFSAGGTLL